ncbi:hypothetical protein [Ochrobactrum sp. A-1]|uniref:hypothetical protein n=1 Tax=Ochrobactrum sp. A-1 TaxID=2920940 RepID=UPI001F0A204B|nr:hypothetical protein [Ochrobactrum sp. A-1]
MTSSIGTSKVTLAAAVANGATVTVPYPTGQTQTSLTGTTGGSVAVGDNDVFPQAASGAGTVAFAFGASNITITNNSGISWPANTVVTAGFGHIDIDGNYNLTWPKQVQDAALAPATP